MKELKEIELIKKVYEDKGRPNNEVQAFALSCLIEYKKQLSICDVSNTLKAYAEWQDTTKIDLGAYTNEEQYKLYLDSF